MTIKEVTCCAPVNIAVIKYWGKRNKELILPTNSSLSVTLDQDDLRSTTTARLIESAAADQLWLNGSQVEITPDSRLARCLAELRRLRAQVEASATDASEKDELPESRRALVIVSENNFPTAAGLASSASGFAALTFTVAQLFELPMPAEQLSCIARQGSGSACRSLLGGFVAWDMGKAINGEDSGARMVAPQAHWPDLEAVICVVSDAKKGTSSTGGMERTVQTSPLLQHRISSVVPARMAEMESAILSKDFDKFSELTIADSNQFHAVCLDTNPPIFYLNDVSRAIISVIEELNRSSRLAGKGTVAAYTFDAGPNAVIYAPRSEMATIVSTLLHYFPLAGSFDDPKRYLQKTSSNLSLPAGFNMNVTPIWPQGSVHRLICTSVGDGPRVLSTEVGKGLITLEGSPRSVLN